MSEYSIDLDALGPSEQHESSLLTLPQNNNHAMDVVHSEDIDGPTDFTQNMEFWMSAKLPNVFKPTKLEGEKKDDLEEYIGSDESLSEYTPKQEHRNKEEVDESVMSVQNPEKHEGGLSFLSDIPEGEGSVGSPDTWCTVEATSPAASLRRQPTVEDYDDTPIRPRSMRSASSSTIGATLRSPQHTLNGKPEVLVVLEGEKDGAKGYSDPPNAPVTTNDESDTIKSLEAALARLRSELGEVQAALSAQESHNSTLEKQLGTQALEHQRLETTINREKEILAESLRVTQEEHSEEIRDWEERYLRLQESMERLEASRLDSEDRIESLESEISQLKTSHEQEIVRSTSTHEKEITSAKAKAEDSISKAREDFESEKADFSLRLSTMEEERDDLRVELALMESTATAKQEDEVLKESLATLEKEGDNLRNQLEGEKATNKALRQDLEKSTKETRPRQSELQATLTATQTALQATQSSLQITQSTLQTTQASLTATQSSLQTTQSSLLAAQLKTTETLKEMHLLREDFTAINATVDAQIKEMMRAREAEWERRFDMLRREKGVMGHVLMGEWGMREVGVNEPQGYRYKFVSRSPSSGGAK
jgi:hypothetical protein